MFLQDLNKNALATGDFYTTVSSMLVTVFQDESMCAW